MASIPIVPKLACAKRGAFAPRVIRLLLASLALTIALPVFAQKELVVTSDGPTSVQNGETILIKARATDGELMLTADEFRLPPGQRDIVATGRVVLTFGAIRLLADRLVFQRAAGAFEAERVRLGAFPYFAEAEAATGTLKEITLLRATATYGEPSAWHPTMVADKIIYAPGQRLRTENSRIGIGHAQPVPLPHLTQNLKQPLVSYVSLTGGFRRSLGLFAEAGLHLPTPNLEGLKLGGDLGVYTSRGVMFGPSGSYERATEAGDLRGSFRSGYINDHGDKKTDILGQPVPENRGFIEWQHTQHVAENLTLNAQLNWWRDSEVLRDFRPRAFFPVQQPDTFAEATYAGANYFVSLFSRFRPNSFQRVQERSPELRFDLLPTRIGDGFYERFSASIAFLHERPLAGGAQFVRSATMVTPANQIARPPDIVLPSYLALLSDGPEQRATRLDAYYSISRPIASGDWLAVTPVVGARLTHYANAQQTTAQRESFADPRFIAPGTRLSAALSALGSHTRTLGEIGFDAALRASGQFAYKNETWKIDGLRHLITPRISYRYIPNDGKNSARIPTIDRDVFSTYLPPLGLGDIRAVDDIASTNVVRLGLENTLQTRDATYGSRDLVSLNLTKDFRLSQRYYSRYNSDVHAELSVAPARWLEAGIYSTMDPRRWRLHEFNSAITLRDGDRWSVRLGNNFLQNLPPAFGPTSSGPIHDYAIDGRWRLHERFDALTRLHYDARKRRFTEQAYGLVQNLDNTWRVSYVVSLYEGRARESRFGLNLQIEAIGF